MRFTSISSLLLPLLCASFASALSVSDRSNVEIPPPTARQIERRDSTVSVRTAKRGTFVGLSLSAVGQDQFSGIRYVQAPTASTRFQRAKALPDQDPSTIHQATATGAPCMQVAQGSLTAAQVSEDCLFMQIIRPHGISSSNPIPVVVFIHGGGWAHGASTFDVYNGTALVQGSVAQKQPIIFVNFNYRLGVFGFLGGKDMQSADAQGTANLNTGYWDQHDALRFIQENIGAFGGDPNRVTIWGQSAGAASVAAHVFANNGKAASGLFSKAIMESGSAQL
ncbi:hypothetical protein OC845_004956 [Tilletia horrida]|nr:hypothetical protein OC845_004956 [Tilletia horrida]